LLGRHARQTGVQGIEEVFEFGVKRLSFFFWGWEWKKRWSTFACFDFARFDFFLLMIVLNQSPDPMASTGVHCGDQFVFRSACLDHKENEGGNRLARKCSLKNCKRIMTSREGATCVDHGVENTITDEPSSEPCSESLWYYALSKKKTSWSKANIIVFLNIYNNFL
jgi:hypothetical protein